MCVSAATPAPLHKKDISPAKLIGSDSAGAALGAAGAGTGAGAAGAGAATAAALLALAPALGGAAVFTVYCG